MQARTGSEVFSRVTDDNLCLFDQTCRVKAIEEAARINFMPNAVYRAETCSQCTLQAAAERDVLRALGVDLFQGYLFARPAFQSAGSVDPASLAG